MRQNPVLQSFPHSRAFQKKNKAAQPTPPSVLIKNVNVLSHRMVSVPSSPPRESPTSLCFKPTSPVTPTFVPETARPTPFLCVSSSDGKLSINAGEEFRSPV